MSAPSECPVCGAAVPPRAKACPACGADERTGWDEEKTRYDSLDLPATAFDDETPQNSSAPRTRINGIAVFWWLVGLGLIIALGFAFLIR